jgi:acyl carrier protein
VIGKHLVQVTSTTSLTSRRDFMTVVMLVPLATASACRQEQQSHSLPGNPAGVVADTTPPFSPQSDIPCPQRPAVTLYVGWSGASPTSKVASLTKQLMIHHLGVDSREVTPHARLCEDLAADSIDMVELIMAFEEEFGVEIEDHQAGCFKTVGDFSNFVSERMTQGR